MLKIISKVGTVATLLTGFIVCIGINVNPIFQFIDVLFAFATFFPIIIKWNLYSIKTHGLFGFSGLKEFINIFKSGILERNENRKRFIFITTWLVYFILFIVIFQFFVMNTDKYGERVITAFFYFGSVPFTSFYFVFIDSVKSITERK